jgi:ferrous iron transport protein B
VADGLIGLTGIVVPYMLPLVLLLVSAGGGRIDAARRLRRRPRLPPDRSPRRRRCAFPLGLGCNVPAISGVARITRGRERVVASMLITFVPCSARSAIMLARGRQVPRRLA